jgi:hypothetical protein
MHDHRTLLGRRVPDDWIALEILTPAPRHDIPNPAELIRLTALENAGLSRLDYSAFGFVFLDRDQLDPIIDKAPTLSAQ